MEIPVTAYGIDHLEQAFEDSSPFMKNDRLRQYQLRDIHPETDDLARTLRAQPVKMFHTCRIDQCVIKRGLQSLSAHFQICLALQKKDELNIRVGMAAEIPFIAVLIKMLTVSDHRRAFMDDRIVFL